MQFPQATPEKGGKGTVDSFSYHNTKPKQPWTGWLAGPIRWVKAHVSENGSKPCLIWMTGGKLPCVRCRGKNPPEMIGYVPVYAEHNNSPLLVIVYDTSYDFLFDAPHLAYLKFERGDDEKERVIGRRVTHQKKYETRLERRRVPFDLQPDLLRIWGISELTEWFRCQPDAPAIHPEPDADTAKERAATRAAVVLDTGKIADLMDMDADARRATADTENKLAKRLRDMKKAEGNGKPGTH